MVINLICREDVRNYTWDRRRETGDLREMCDRRRETVDVRQET